MPAASVGRFSDRNLNGWEIVRRDLPMIQKIYSWETPNFGDAATYGSHTHWQKRDVYQREIFQPSLYKIEIELLNSPGTGIALVKFWIEQVFDRKSPSFENELLFAVNLLQENTGVSGVFRSDATREEFIGTQQLDWEIFPPGNGEELIASLARRHGGLSPQARHDTKDRVRLFQSLPVERFIRGGNSFAEYFGALYANDLVVFESLNYGNALYVLYDDWEDVSKRSRTELLKGTTKNYDRFPYTEGWQDRFRDHIQVELKNRGRHTQTRRRR